MPRNPLRGSNYKDGLYVDIDGTGGLTDEKFIPGSRFEIAFPIAAANIPQAFWTAPYPCKVVRAYERHATVAGQAGTLQVEKTPSGTAPGSGTTTLASAFDLTSTANTNVIIQATATTANATLAAGNSLSTKLASGAATSYAGGVVTVVLEWL